MPMQLPNTLKNRIESNELSRFEPSAASALSMYVSPVTTRLCMLRTASWMSFVWLCVRNTVQDGLSVLTRRKCTVTHKNYIRWGPDVTQKSDRNGKQQVVLRLMHDVVKEQLGAFPCELLIPAMESHLLDSIEPRFSWLIIVITLISMESGRQAYKDGDNIQCPEINLRNIQLPYGQKMHLLEFLSQLPSFPSFLLKLRKLIDMAMLFLMVHFL